MLTRDVLQQRRTARVSQSAPRSILTPLEQRVIDKIEELQLESLSFDEQEESMSLVLSAVSRSVRARMGCKLISRTSQIDTLDLAEASWRHRLYGISFKPVLLLSLNESSSAKKYQRTLEFAKALAVSRCRLERTTQRKQHTDARHNPRSTTFSSPRPTTSRQERECSSPPAGTEASLLTIPSQHNL